MLATAEYPEAYFVATRFGLDAAGDVKEVRGEFTLRGVGEPLSLVARRSPVATTRHCGARSAAAISRADLKRSRFGATLGEPFVGDDVHLVDPGRGDRPVTRRRNAAAR